MSTASARTEHVLRAGITARPPRLLMADRQHTEGSFDADDARRLLSEGVLRRPRPGSVVVYQVRSGEHQQTGVVAEVPVADYRSGRVRPHEATDPERVRKLVEYTETARLEHSPVMLTHAPRDGLRDMLAAVTATAPDVDLPDDVHTHRVWVSEDDVLLRAVWEELESLSTVYIADGHHRMASADRYAARHNGLDPDDPAAFTLGVLFPSDEMRIFGYPRCVSWPAGWSTEKLVTALATAPGAAGIEECTPTEASHPVPDTAAVFVDGRWYRLRLREAHGGVRASLACVRLDERVITPLFGQGAWAASPGAHDSASLAGWCAARETIGFLPYPPSVAQVMAVSDANSVMPPKSTWFHPKAPQGLFARELA
ncbi:uncharacterized protein (DUF1015 family) [Lipingzhangella halophila]|uniref:Uncharacterized protein (DUF1015 family) n=1 Tax=Lipingzhangella halophila TaxID=1783352 RepID=A0A7W7W1F4_9ACTN|nr:DUF1015 family protein [Lipingzhangella halophila]MBB4929625.1 uncharacterized protein (DUF1015 family) [Lipingzhangella halophila]